MKTVFMDIAPRHDRTTAARPCARAGRYGAGAAVHPNRKAGGVLRPLIEQADAIAAVLPVELLAELVTLADERPVLQSVSGRRFTGSTLHLADGQTEPEIAFEHTVLAADRQAGTPNPAAVTKGEQRFSCSPQKNFFVKC